MTPGGSEEVRGSWQNLQKQWRDTGNVFRCIANCPGRPHHQEASGRLSVSMPLEFPGDCQRSVGLEILFGKPRPKIVLRAPGPVSMDTMWNVTCRPTAVTDRASPDNGPNVNISIMDEGPTMADAQPNAVDQQWLTPEARYS